jgi:hypothetical protein
MGYVGDWRPHKPRGPIGAHFKSPGPKYSLPSTVGRDGHDGRKKQAPAHSFGTRHAKFSSDCSPGPGAYAINSSITRRGGNGTPKYSLYGRHKELRPFSTPGPGQYSPEQAGKSAYYSAPTYSLSGRTKGHKSDQSPGPAAYGLNSCLGVHVITQSSAPAYSMTARATVGSFHEDLRKTPGPGTYKPVDPSLIKRKGPSYSMIGRNLMPTDCTRKPGPGAHCPEKVKVNKPHNPTFSFGITHSDYCNPLILNIDNTAY